MYSPKRDTLNSSQRIHPRSILKTPNSKAEYKICIEFYLGSISRALVLLLIRKLKKAFPQQGMVQKLQEDTTQSSKKATRTLTKNLQKSSSINFTKCKLQNSSSLTRGDQRSNNQIDPPCIEARLNNLRSQSLQCYEQRKGIKSPYQDGAKNLRYSSQNQVSNIVFYDQTTNLSLKKSEMYTTTNQREYSSPKKKCKVMKSHTLNPREDIGYFNPSSIMINKHNKHSTIKPTKQKISIKKTIDPSVCSEKPPVIPRESNICDKSLGKPPIHNCRNKNKTGNKCTKRQKPSSPIQKYTGRADTISRGSCLTSGSNHDTGSVCSYRSYKSNHLSSVSRERGKNKQLSDRNYEVCKQSNYSKSDVMSVGSLSRKKENFNKTVKFEYVGGKNKKRKHHLLNRVRGCKKESKLTKNQKKTIQKPDHFVDLFTGDQAKTVHEKRSKVNECLKEKIMNSMMSSNIYHINSKKEFLQRHYLSKSIITIESNQINTNGVSLPMKHNTPNKNEIKRKMNKALTQQMEYKRLQKDNEIMQKYHQEIEHNNNHQAEIDQEKMIIIQKKTQQREELRKEMERVLEMKRIQKLQAHEQEYQNCL
ncbi:unnamed protein product [Moneuplotes crassus]|uniref:Uncharacterized protein n=1 Tax=Euplotes crassus TaxID=5936 RepID=A0AAD1X6X1_EUPCR|nr:unnamed protein product [Moneuplotes crassus]